MALTHCILGVAIGAGWQTAVAYVNIGCYYLIGVPLGLTMGYALNFGVSVKPLSLSNLKLIKVLNSCAYISLFNGNFSGNLVRNDVWHSAADLCSILDGIQNQLE